MPAALDSFSNSLNGLSSSINRLLFFVGAAATGIMAIPTVLDVLSRLLFRTSIRGVVELVEFCLVLLVFGCMGFLNDKRAHIKVDLFMGRFSQAGQRCLEFAYTICGIVLISLMTFCLFKIGMHKMAGREVSTMLSIPVHYFAFFAMVGAATFTLALVAQLVDILAKMVRDNQWVAILMGLVLAAVLLGMAFFLKNTILADFEMNTVLGALGMLLLLVLILFGMPIGIAMGMVGVAGMIVFQGMWSPSIIIQLVGGCTFTTGTSYTLTIVPMFVLMGELAMYSGISRDLFQAARVWLGRMPGGLAIAGVAGCAGFSAVCGDSMATAVTMASVALPEMREYKYDPGLSCASLAAGGTLGILIPPSTGFIFYSLVTEVSIGKLFVAGVIPGICLAIIFGAIVYIIAKRNPELAPPGPATTLMEKLLVSKNVIVMVLLVLLILGGILRGWFSPNEGGAVGAAATFLYALARRRLPWKNFTSALFSAARITTALLLILIGVDILGKFLAATQLPNNLADLVVGMDINRWGIFAAVVVFYILLGSSLNVIPMILLTLPAIFPSINALGFDPVWFGVIIVILMEMGQITPPVGIVVFALGSIAPDVPLTKIFWFVMPFFFGMCLMVLLLAFFPALATWLPSVLI